MLAIWRSGPGAPLVRSPGSNSTTALLSDPVFVTHVHFPGHGGRIAKGCSVPDPYDVLTIAAIADELSATIGNGRIQRIGLLDPRTIGAEIYAGGQRHYLIASANDRQPRLRLAPDMPSLDSALITPFGLLLRKHTRGGIILSIDQPPLERLVGVSIAKRQAPLKTRRDAPEPDAMDVEDGELGKDAGDGEDDELEVFESQEGVALNHVTLYVELMGRHSNVILVDNEGRIMESAKRVTRDMSRVRPVLPRLPYIPPPPPDRLDPRSVTPVSAARLLETSPPDAELARALVSAYRGISPVMAREIVFRATGSSETRVGDLHAESVEALTRNTLALLEPLRTTTWSPRVYRERGHADPGDVVTCSPILMTHLAGEYEVSPIESMSEALALAESAADRPPPARHAQRRQRLLDSVATAREKAERRLAALASESARAAEAESLKTAGELIYAYLWQIAPGQVSLDVNGASIPLDPGLTANENAQAYFERYRKAQSAEAQLPGLVDESRAEIAYLDQLATLIAQAPGFSELESLAAEWAEQVAPDPASRPKKTTAPRRPRALVDDHGNSVYVGRSGPQNELVTFEIAGPDDTWLHARGVGGSHVVIRWRSPESAESPETVEAAAALAAWYSAARESGRVEVDVAPRRYVRKIKGARPGMVTYRNERTIRVQPAPEERLRHILSDR
jgi:predicted ribosome quality control (RQC) complex YloA/Tae2 family protein